MLRHLYDMYICVFRCYIKKVNFSCIRYLRALTYVYQICSYIITISKLYIYKEIGCNVNDAIHDSV